MELLKVHHQAHDIGAVLLRGWSEYEDHWSLICETGELSA